MGRVYKRRMWHRIRLEVLTDAPWCQLCLALGLLMPATEVDHITPVREDPEASFDRDNLQGLCASHHSGAKRQQERRGYHAEVDALGYPIDAAHPANRGEVVSSIPRAEYRAVPES